MEETRLLLEEKIAYHRKCLRQLLLQRNELVPVSKLPPEILARIFSFVSARRTRSSPIFPCYNFTHVSYSWRSVALNTPNLWAVLPQGRRWRREMLERSKGTGLVVRSVLANDSARRLLFLKEVFTKHTSRIRELLLSQITAKSLATLFQDLRPSSLRLEGLELTNAVKGSPTFPADLLDTEVLRLLRVTNCDGPWYSLSLPALLFLKLHKIANRPPFTKFLEMLRGLPALRYLDLDDSLPSENDAVGQFGVVNLSQLRSLSLASSSNQKEVTNILSLIIVPSTTTLKFVAGRDFTFQESDSILDEMSSSFSTFFSHFQQGEYRSVYVASTRVGHLHLKAWKYNELNSTADLDLELCIHDRENQMLDRIFPSLPLLDITALTLDGSTHCSLPFGHFPNLRNIKIVRDCIVNFVKFLAWKPDNYDTEPSTDYGVPLPALQSLWIHKCSLRWEVLEELQDCLMDRCERRAGFLKLKLTECLQISGRDVESLREIVSDVKWDGLQ